MNEQQPQIETIDVTGARRDWDDLLDQVRDGGTRVLIVQDGVPVAAVVPAVDLARLVRLDEERARDFAVLDDIGEAFADVPAAELEREVARALAEVRAERREDRGVAQAEHHVVKSA